MHERCRRVQHREDRPGDDARAYPGPASWPVSVVSDAGWRVCAAVQHRDRGQRRSGRAAARRAWCRRLPASPGYPALQTSLTGNGPRRLFAKTGLVIRPGATFELIVPAPFSSRLSIGWNTPGNRVIVRNCASPGRGGWLAYVGGYWIDHPACVPIIVRAGNRQLQVHIGLGTACPGQRSPQGPSQS